MPELVNGGRRRFGRGVAAGRVLARAIDAAALVGSRVSPRVAHALAVAGGNIEWALRPQLRRVLGENLARAVDAEAGSSRVGRLVRREVVNEAKRSADLLWAIGRPQEFVDSVVIEGAEHARNAAGRGRGMLLVGIHLGGWEVATSVPRAIMGRPVSVVTADDWLAWGIDHVRRSAGLRPIRVGATLELARVLTRGECLLLLGDNALDGRAQGRVVEFCGSRARLPAGPVALARIAQSPIVTFDVLPIARRRWRVTVEPPLEPPISPDDETRVLQQLANRWTATIRAHPDWWAARFAVEWEPDR